MSEQLYVYYTCNFCDVISIKFNDFKTHLNKIHFPENAKHAVNVTTTVQQEIPDVDEHHEQLSDVAEREAEELMNSDFKTKIEMNNNNKFEAGNELNNLQGVGLEKDKMLNSGSDNASGPPYTCDICDVNFTEIKKLFFHGVINHKKHCKDVHNSDYFDDISKDDKINPDVSLAKRSQPTSGSEPVSLPALDPAKTKDIAVPTKQCTKCDFKCHSSIEILAHCKLYHFQAKSDLGQPIPAPTPATPSSLGSQHRHPGPGTIFQNQVNVKTFLPQSSQHQDGSAVLTGSMKADSRPPTMKICVQCHFECRTSIDLAHHIHLVHKYSAMSA